MPDCSNASPHETRLHDWITIGAGGRVIVNYCRGCSAWFLTVLADPLTGGDDSEQTGYGVESYQDALEDLARQYPAFAAAPFLWDIGGHLHADTGEVY